MLVRTSALPAFALYFIMCAVWLDVCICFGMFYSERSLVLSFFAFSKANVTGRAGVFSYTVLFFYIDL